jgi:hypothetical protein
MTDETPQSEQASELPKLAAAGISPDAIERGVPIGGLEDMDFHDHEALKGIDHWQDIHLKKRYAKLLLWLVVAQLFVADAVFVAYAWAGRNWILEAGVIQVWLGATFVELVGIVLVITRYLFPRRDQT